MQLPPYQYLIAMTVRYSYPTLLENESCEVFGFDINVTDIAILDKMYSITAWNWIQFVVADVMNSNVLLLCIVKFAIGAQKRGNE